MAATRSPAGWHQTSPSPRAPAGNLKPAKDKSTERIDGIVAAIMAIGRAMVAQEEPQQSTPCSLFEWRRMPPRLGTKLLQPESRTCAEITASGSAKSLTCSGRIVWPRRRKMRHRAARV
jgi:hypothetical protein